MDKLSQKYPGFIQIPFVCSVSLESVRIIMIMKLNFKCDGH